jgi:PadR family transcriptional regulator, regulatory protein PadR
MTADPNLLKGNLELILLSILEHSEMYGLEIIEEANTQTDGYFEFKEGSVYPALHRLTQQGFLTASFKPSPRGGMPSRYYAISETGQHELARKQLEFDKFNGAVKTLWGKT